MGITTDAGARDNAVVKQAWASNPAHPISNSQGAVLRSGSLMSWSYPAVIRPNTNCVVVNQSKIAKVLCVRVSLRVNMAVNAKQMAHKAAARKPVDIP